MRLLFLAVFYLFSLSAHAQNTVPASIYDFKLPEYKGGEIDLAKYKGKKILIVNMPVNTDNARQYPELQALYEKYKDKLVIIGVMANDFAIEPGSRKNPQPRIMNYGVTFPQTSKLGVKGEGMSVLYQWLTEKKYNHLKDSEVKWDFQKYLVNETGTLSNVFDPKIKADAPQLLAAINN